VVSDARLGGDNVHQVVERLLSISGEDMLTVDRKYRDPWTGTLPSRFFIVSNELPRFGDASGAISRWFIVLALTRSWLGEEDTTLTGELLGELAGILRWALDGLDRLASTGRFTEPASSADAILALQDLVSPMAAFVRDHCTIGIGRQVPVTELYAQWKTWCEDNGRKPSSIQIFGRDLRPVVPRLRVAQSRDGETRERCYVGLALKSLADNGADRVPPRAEPDDATLARNGTRRAIVTPPLRRLGTRPRHPNPRPVGAISSDLGADPCDVQIALERLANRGALTYHPPTTGPPTWSLPPEAGRRVAWLA
jgi:putative DNA primase/helicase